MKWLGHEPLLSTREQGILGLEEIPDAEILLAKLMSYGGDSRFSRIQFSRRRAGQLAVEILRHGIDAECDTLSIEEQDVIEAGYDKATLRRPGVIVDTQFFYSARDAKSLGLPQSVAEDGEPCAGVVPVRELMQDGLYSLWDLRDKLSKAGGNANHGFAGGMSAAGAAMGIDASTYFNAANTEQQAQVEETITRIEVWRENRGGTI